MPMWSYLVTRKLYLVCYDIADKKDRNNVRRIVKSFSSGGQKSAYECYLSSAEFNLLINLTRAHITPTDNLVIQPINEKMTVRVIGLGMCPSPINSHYIG